MSYTYNQKLSDIYILLDGKAPLWFILTIVSPIGSEHPSTRPPFISLTSLLVWLWSLTNCAPIYPFADIQLPGTIHHYLTGGYAANSDEAETTLDLLHEGAKGLEIEFLTLVNINQNPNVFCVWLE